MLGGVAHSTFDTEQLAQGNHVSLGETRDVLAQVAKLLARVSSSRGRRTNHFGGAIVSTGDTVSEPMFEEVRTNSTDHDTVVDVLIFVEMSRLDDRPGWMKEVDRQSSEGLFQPGCPVDGADVIVCQP